MGWTLRFEEIGIEDVPRVGGKNASLGEMIRALGPRGVRVPDGFAVTADAYRHFLRESGLEQQIAEILAGLSLDDVADLQRRGLRIRQALLHAPIPPDLEQEIAAAYEALSAGSDAAEGGIDVAIRSSATAEDLPDASFAGQQETYLNVRGRQGVVDATRRCFASLFTDRAISYRAERGYEPLSVALSVGVQRMVRSDLASSGVAFSIDTETGFPDVVLISAAWGLGENVVQGAVVPDEFMVFKPTLREGFRPIVRKTLGTKEFRMVYDTGGGRMTRNVPVSAADRARFALSDDDILELARQVVEVEAHYGRPMDVEWAKDGRTDELFVVQARPETVHARRPTAIERFTLEGTAPVVVSGRAVGERIGVGPARVVRSVEELGSFRDGEILVADRTDPDWEPVMRRAAAIVTSSGGRTCHAAIVSRELGLPAIVGAEGAQERLQDGERYTVSCAQGETGFVYEGEVPFRVDRVELGETRRPRTKVMLIVGNPAEALRLSQLPNEGVGLARQEFIVGGSIGVHPMAVVEYDEQPPEVRAEIDRRSAGWDDKVAWFVDQLAEGIGTIAAAFHPKPVIVRLGDFKTNEYAHLVGGAAYEPDEENPMLGFRGASRYDHPRYAPAFELECRAIRKVREGMGLRNLKVMVPFCRTVEEGRRVLEAMGRHGLERGREGLEVYIMCEIPSNAILAERFAELFDGFSIGSNDLTQLVLGVDRDSAIVASVFDERNDAVKWTIERAIRNVHASGRPIGICGQAPSDHPEFARFLVELGIDSISLNPDALMSGTERILEAEAGWDPQLVELLDRVPPLAALSVDDRARLATIARREEASVGTVLFREGEPSDAVLLLVEGRVALSLRCPGRPETTLITVGPGELLGWSGLLPDARRVATGRVTERATLIRMERAAALDLCERDHDIGFALMRLAFVEVSRRLHDTRLQLLDMYGERPCEPQA